MAADDVFPRRNLGPGEEWGRTVENRLVVVERLADVSRAGLSGQNRSTAASLESLARQLSDIEAQNAAIAAQNIAILDNQTQINATQTFLLNQTLYAANSNGMTVARGASAGISLESYDPTYDLSLSFTSSSTGLLSITVSAQLLGTTGISGMLGFEVSWATGSIGVDFSRSATVSDAMAVSTRVSLVTVPANTPVTVVTRRAWTGGTSGTVRYAYPSLSVTKIGI